jgi:hypothetical protein
MPADVGGEADAASNRHLARQEVFDTEALLAELRKRRFHVEIVDTTVR